MKQGFWVEKYLVVYVETDYNLYTEEFETYEEASEFVRSNLGENKSLIIQAGATDPCSLELDIEDHT